MGQFPKWAFAAKWITSEYAVIQAQSGEGSLIKLGSRSLLRIENQPPTVRPRVHRALLPPEVV